jgi:hypothetical protein
VGLTVLFFLNRQVLDGKKRTSVYLGESPLAKSWRRSFPRSSLFPQENPTKIKPEGFIHRGYSPSISSGVFLFGSSVIIVYAPSG